MAIAYGSQQFNNGTSTALTFSFTTSGSDRYLVVGFTAQDSGTGITGVTYAGVSMTKLTGPTSYGNAGGPSGNNRIYMYGLTNPASGANNVVISSSSSVSMFCYTVYITGADQGTSNAVATNTLVGNSTPNSGSKSLSVDTTGTNGCGILIHDGNNFGAPTYTGSTATNFFNNGGESTATCNAFPQSSGGNYTFTWTYSAGSGLWGAAAVAIGPATSSVTSNAPFFLALMSQQ